MTQLAFFDAMPVELEAQWGSDSQGHSSEPASRRPRGERATPSVESLPDRAGELVADASRCAWRDCPEPATWSLGFGRLRGALLVANYCGAHADDVERLFRVEARTHARSSILAPRYARACEALEAEISIVLGGCDK